MRFLFTAQVAPSHLRPMIPLAWALTAAGHQVVVACPPNMTAGPRSLGLSTVGFGEPYDPIGTIRGRLPDGVASPIRRWGGRVAPEHYAGIGRGTAKAAAARVESLLEFAREWRPDAVVHEPTEVTGRLVAGALGIPAYRHRWGIDTFGAEFERGLREVLPETCERLGFDVGGLASAGAFDPCPASVQVPTAAPGIPMKYVAHNGAGDVPPWALRRGSRPRVSVTLGSITVDLGGGVLLKAVLAALSGLDIEVVAALRREEIELVGELPSNVTAVEGLPIDLFMGTCDLAVNHGGSGSVYTSVAAGVPQLVLPQLLHEFDTGDALERLGAGLTLDTPEQQEDVALLRDTVGKILGSPAHRGAAATLAAENAARPEPTAVAAELVNRLEAR